MAHAPIQDRPIRAFVGALVFTLGVVASGPGVAQVLSEADFRANVVGAKLTGMFGTHLTFQADGTVVGGLTGDGNTRGTWRFDGAALCTAIQDGGGPTMTNCGVPELTKRHLVVDGPNGLRLQHPR